PVLHPVLTRTPREVGRAVVDQRRKADAAFVTFHEVHAEHDEFREGVLVLPFEDGDLVAELVAPRPLRPGQRAPLAVDAGLFPPAGRPPPAASPPVFGCP